MLLIYVHVRVYVCVMYAYLCSILFVQASSLCVTEGCIVDLYACTHTCIHAHTHTRIHAHNYTHIHAPSRTYTSQSSRFYICVLTSHTCIQLYTHTHVHTVEDVYESIVAVLYLRFDCSSKVIK